MYSDQNIIRSKKDFQNIDICQTWGVNFSILKNFLSILRSKFNFYFLFLLYWLTSKCENSYFGQFLTWQNINFGQKLDLQIVQKKLYIRSITWRTVRKTSTYSNDVLYTHILSSIMFLISLIYVFHLHKHRKVCFCSAECGGLKVVSLFSKMSQAVFKERGEKTFSAAIIT